MAGVVDIGSIMQAGNQATQQGIDLFQYFQNRADKKAARQALNNWNKTASGMLEDQQSELDKLIASQSNLSTADDLQRYQQLKQDLADPSKYIYQADEFDASKYNVDDYLNENKDKILADITKATQNTAAGAGMGHSSGTVQNIANNVMDKSEQLYNDAYTKMTNERNFDYGQYTDFINRQQQNLNQMYQMNQNTMQGLQNDIQFDQNQNMQNYQLQQDINNSKLALGQSNAQSKANLMV